jgi:ATP-dependent RNA helicase SUPV3L1/SUV3
LRNVDIARSRGVTAVLGPTNTGKTHLAIERMLGHDTGLIGLPLRLLAREVYDKIAGRVGADKVALITGEEKIKPEQPRYWVCTVEAMPRDVTVDFLAIDEIQLAGDPERGHVFTDRLLHARGAQETLLLGAQTMREAINDILPGANHISRPRLSKLAYSGQKKLSRLPRRSAVVAFSANDVYAIAELMRRQRGGAAVVLGALSPRTRNAQVALYQSGDVDFMVATDAIGMGINLDVDHVAFAGLRKFDGHVHRELTPAEIGQIAGRAGRHMNDGTFGVTADVEPLSADLIDRLETHTFEPVRVLQWRNRTLDFSTIERLKESLRDMPNHARLQRARMSDDMMALENVALDPAIADLARSEAAVRMLWDVCQVPDYRKISSANHAELVAQIFSHLRSGDGRIPEDWFASQVAFADRTDGDIDTLATRISHIRTWTFVSNRAEWLANPEHWQARTREIEDKLSDALHECLTQRFVDRRTSVLMRKLNDKDELVGEIADDGAIRVENHYVGRLTGFRFVADTTSTDLQGRAARNAASHVVARELQMRARRVASAQAEAFKITRQARLMWRGEEIARIERGDDPLRPVVQLIADESLNGPDRERVQKRLDDYLRGQIEDKLKPLAAIARAEDVWGLARGIAFRLKENYGILKRDTIADEMRSLDQTARAQLRKYGVRFGAFNIYFPMLLKPAAADLTLILWSLQNAGTAGLDPSALPEPPRPGLTSVPADLAIPEAFYRAAGFHVCGPRAVRIDILERLADLIRPLIGWRPRQDAPSVPPKGASGDGGFHIIPEMMSIMGCGAEELGTVLKSLGFWVERRKKRPADPMTSGSVPTTTGATAGADAASAVATEDGELTLEAAAADEAAPTETVASPTNVDEKVAPAIEAAASPITETSVPLADAAGSEPPPEPEYEEVWRPRRRRAAAQVDAREGRRGDSGRERSWGRRHGARATGAGNAPATTATPVPADRKPQHRDRDRRQDRPAADGGKRDRKEGRLPRHENRRRDGDRARMVQSAAPSRGTAADPDSPFAALGALKAVLEKRSGKDGTS